MGNTVFLEPVGKHCRLCCDVIAVMSLHWQFIKCGAELTWKEALTLSHMVEMKCYLMALLPQDDRHNVLPSSKIHPYSQLTPLLMVSKMPTTQTF